MGFRKDAFATIWSVEPMFETLTKARISISRKNRQTGEYETDFSGFVAFVGTAAATKALKLKEKDRIRLGDVDVTNKYDKEKIPPIQTLSSLVLKHKMRLQKALIAQSQTMKENIYYRLLSGIGADYGYLQCFFVA